MTTSMRKLYSERPLPKVRLGTIESSHITPPRWMIDGTHRSTLLVNSIAPLSLSTVASLTPGAHFSGTSPGGFLPFVVSTLFSVHISWLAPGGIAELVPNAVGRRTHRLSTVSCVVGACATVHARFISLSYNLE
jgi:hypothetical protein